MASKLNQIHHTDCVKGLAGLRPGSVDLAFADPPFNIGYNYDVYDDRRDYNAYLDWSRKWMSAVVRALKPTGTFWLAIGDEYSAELKLIAQNELGLICRSWVVWYYTFGVNCKMKFSRSHAHLLHFIRSPDEFTFNDQAIRVPSARQLVYADRRANPKGRLPDDTWILRPQDLPEGFQPDQDTWYFPRVCGTFKERKGWHGCQMPEQLLGRIIRACSNEGDVVLDPFAGSGTTLAVAKKLGRKYIGFELSKEYTGRINKRLKAAKPGDPLEGPAEPLNSAPATPPAAPSRKTGSGVLTREKTALRAEHGKKASPSLSGAEGDISEAIKRAYWAASQGFSTDRVIADPDLNAAFAQACEDLRVPGTPADWNHRLLGLRKGSKLNQLPKARRTTICREDLDEFVFASEIAWALLSERHDLSLDDILCDPPHAERFDGLCCSLAPGWSSFHYRWGALCIRKKASNKRSLARRIPSGLRRIQFPRRMTHIRDIPTIPTGSGLYLVRVQDENFYVGETLRLRDRIKKQLSREAMKAVEISASETRVAVRRLDAPWQNLWGIQAQLMANLKPRANWSKQFATQNKQSAA